jgi:spoIIIJ-associated protein
LAKSDSIKDAVDSFVNFLEEEQEKENIIKNNVQEKENIQNSKTGLEKTNEIHGNGFERLADIVKKAIEIITMDKEVRVEPDRDQGRIGVYGKDLAIVIGKNGTGMAALEYLVNLIGKRKKLVDKNIVIDIKDYRKKNDEKIKEALKERKTIALRPMPSHERKIVHNVLSKIKNIRTKSRDDEPNRRIVIYPMIKE